MVVDDRGVIFAQPCDLGSGFFAVAPLHPLEHPFQRIGRLAHRRDDDEEVLFVVDDIAQVAHPLSIADRCSAEFIDLHILVSRFTLFEPSCCPTAHGRCADTDIPSPLSPPLAKGGAYAVSAFTCFILHLGSQPTGIPTLSYSLKVPYPCFPFFLIRAVVLSSCA